MYLDFRGYLQKRLTRIRRRFRSLWKSYLLQSLLAALVVAIVFIVLSIEYIVIVSSLGSTAFIIFAMPGSNTANPRRVIGGHVIGLVCGSLLSLIPHTTLLPLSIMVYSLAVGLSIVLMVALDFEHPPASGTALGVAITGPSPQLMLTVLTGSIVLSIAHVFLKKHLKDLV